MQSKDCVFKESIHTSPPPLQTYTVNSLLVSATPSSVSYLPLNILVFDIPCPPPHRISNDFSWGGFGSFLSYTFLLSMFHLFQNTWTTMLPPQGSPFFPMLPHPLPPCKLLVRTITRNRYTANVEPAILSPGLQWMTSKREQFWFFNQFSQLHL